MITTKVVVVQQLYTVLLPFKNTCSAAHKCSRRERERQRKECRANLRQASALRKKQRVHAL